MFTQSYQTIEEVLQNSNALVGAAEAHGLLTGMFCADAETDRDRWLSVILGDFWRSMDDGELDLLTGLWRGTYGLLEAGDFSFDLFLPGDDVGLAERASALGGWCQGFLDGIGYAGGEGWSGDCAEFLNDLTDICQLDPSVSDDSEEAAFSEISEFVRVGVQIVWMDSKRPAVSSNRLH